MMKSLKILNHVLADAEQQLAVLEDEAQEFPAFSGKLADAGHPVLKPAAIETLQINVGKMCNQVCKHCHVDAGPDRKEIMTRETMQQCLDVLKASPSMKTVDLTGGAPELNPDFRWFVAEIKKLHKHIIVRCNLTIIVANKRFNDLPQFFKLHDIEVVSSLPSYTADRTDRQRGGGVFEDSIKALQMLNGVGYGKKGSGLLLNLVYNPAGAFLPPSQVALEKEYKHELAKKYGICFNELYAITNIPVSRYLDYLLQSGNFKRYMDKLIAAYNPQTLDSLMCRSTLSVGWDGFLYDCDFNQMLDLKVASAANHIADYNSSSLAQRNIVINQHCYGCTAGSGSSCGGTVVGEG